MAYMNVTSQRIPRRGSNPFSFVYRVTCRGAIVGTCTTLRQAHAIAASWDHPAVVDHVDHTPVGLGIPATAMVVAR